MKPPVIFHSIYARFAAIFIAIWWGMNTLAFGAVIKVLSGSSLVDMRDILLIHADEMRQVRSVTSLIFLGSGLFGTVLILLAVRSIVRPIKKLSTAAGRIAGGDFTVRLKAGGADEISQLTEDFNQMAKSLQGIDILRKDFVANVSHEFKTPITAIRGFANLISEGNLPDEQMKDYAKMIASESLRLSLLSANLLRLSELDANLVREQARSFALDEQIRKSVLLLEIQWGAKDIEFDIELEPVLITTAEHLLKEVWLNLIGNAIKFSPAGRVIRIRLTRQGSMAVVEIADQGIGINDEDKLHIFERFFVGDKSRSTDSNGMGLAIVKKIVDMAGGTISFSSERGHGATFTVALPLNQNQVEAPHVR